MNKKRAGFIAIVGDPNAGKSTLANVLVGEKFTIVSDKPQTTRKRSLGIINTSTAQIVLSDAPGFIEKTTGLNDFIQTEIEDLSKDTDAFLILLPVDLRGPEQAEKILSIFKNQKKPWAVAITKADLKQSHRISIIQALIPEGIPCYPVSAVSAPEASRNVLIPVLENMLPFADGPLFEDTSLFTTQNVKQMTAEWVREKCFQFLHQEVPYGLAVQIRKWDEGDKVVSIYADVVVEKATHRKMVVGQGGQTLKMIGMNARKEIEKLLDQKVYLELHVAVKEKWTKNKMIRKELGF